ncbi:hypothetical protein [Streptomyces leeuwenhoekii]|uniref:Sle1_088 protein n=1 Tax=Streptomyces leeuwenhoekii TaxID=1437453 RepID=A0A0F7VL18_STRLW|nr:hypothetical protein [Streptomyces leeuwenhoekii]CQR59255.1 sle1_088 [Streptomyces leeuwenhoekii]
MTPLAAAAAALGLVTAGYALGRYRPARRVSDWANWAKYDQSIRRHRARWWAIWAVLAAENLAWCLAHPRQDWDAWKHRNDPPPPRSPAVTVRRINEPRVPDHRVDEEA